MADNPYLDEVTAWKMAHDARAPQPGGGGGEGFADMLAQDSSQAPTPAPATHARHGANKKETEALMRFLESGVYNDVLTSRSPNADPDILPMGQMPPWQQQILEKMAPPGESGRPNKPYGRDSRMDYPGDLDLIQKMYMREALRAQHAKRRPKVPGSGQ